MQALVWRFIRSSVTTALAAWWSSKQSDPRWLAGIPIIHSVFKFLRDKYPNNQIINALPF